MAASSSVLSILRFCRPLPRILRPLRHRRSHWEGITGHYFATYHSKNQEVLKSIRNLVFVVESERVWHGVVLLYDLKGLKEEDTSFRISTLHFLSVEFKLETNRVLKSYFRYGGGPDSDRRIRRNLKYGGVQCADDFAFGNCFGVLVAVYAGFRGKDTGSCIRRMDRNDGGEG